MWIPIKLSSSLPESNRTQGFWRQPFRDWRYNSDDTPKADFVLNDTTYSGKILVGGKTLVLVPREHALGQFMITVFVP
jgi:3-isopropylmalate/(R)-2-methylmalate dehydratase small subunit